MLKTHLQGGDQRHISSAIKHVVGSASHSISQAVQFNLLRIYGLHMPILLDRMYRQHALSVAAVLVSALVAVAVSMYVCWGLDRQVVPNKSECHWMAGIGFLLFFCGIGLFLNTSNHDFTTPGLANRIVIAATLGPACIIVAVVGRLAGQLPWREWRSLRRRTRDRMRRELPGDEWNCVVLGAGSAATSGNFDSGITLPPPSTP